MLSKMSEDIKSLNVFSETPKNKNNCDAFLTNLCKSSKKLIKNSRKYNSYIELPKYLITLFLKDVILLYRVMNQVLILI